MKKHLAAVAALAATPFAAHASDLLGLSVRVGPSYPLDSDTRDATANVGYNGGLRFQLPFPGLLSSLIGTSSGIDLEGFQAKDDSDTINYLGLTYFEQVRLAALGPVRPYAGLGVGAYRLGVKSEAIVTEIISSGSSTFTTTHTASDSDDGFRVGGRAMVGVELPLHLFAELSAVAIGKLDGASANTINLAVGLRF
jgi:hypothetical protein